MTELRDLLSTLNPWWAERPFETGKPRPLYFEKIRRYLSTGEILVLSGVRRSGKTTLLYQIIHELITEKNVPPRNILFVNCDEQEIYGIHHPITTVVETYRKEVHPRGTIYLVFDEIQNVHDWERAVKSLYDRKNYRIIISGSSSYLLDSQLSELLSGRYLTVPVFPLDFFEYLSFHGIAVSDDPVNLAADKYEILSRLKQYMVEGGFPLVGLEAKGRDAQCPSGFVSHHEEWRHPANMMAERPFADAECKRDDQPQHEIQDHIAMQVCDGKAIGCCGQRVNLLYPVHDQQRHYG